MQSLITGAQGAPPISPDTLRRTRVLVRVNVSLAVAGVLCGLAWGADRRDHGALLVDLTACRTASAGAVRL